jgi:hypothetical protein
MRAVILALDLTYIEIDRFQSNRQLFFDAKLDLLVYHVPESRNHYINVKRLTFFDILLASRNCLLGILSTLLLFAKLKREVELFLVFLMMVN